MGIEWYHCVWLLDLTFVGGNFFSTILALSFCMREFRRSQYSSHIPETYHYVNTWSLSINQRPCVEWLNSVVPCDLLVKVLSKADLTFL